MLVLKLISVGIIHACMKSEKMLGKLAIKPKHVEFCLGKVTLDNDLDGGTYETLALNHDEYWHGFNFRW